MSDERASAQSKALPLAAIVTCLATAFAISNGLFDRGATQGSSFERVNTIEKLLERIETGVLEVKSSQNSMLHKVHETEVMIKVLSEKIKQNSEETERLNRRVDQIQSTSGGTKK